MTPEQVAELRRQHYNATVTELQFPNPDLMILRLTPDFPRPPHQPGQYTSIGLGNWEPRHPSCPPEPLDPAAEMKLVRRAYSISCSILDGTNDLLDVDRTNWLEFYIVLVRDSTKEKPPALTPRLFMLKVGDRLNIVKKITGHFTLDPVQPDDTVVFLSTGTGEAPHNYMVWDLLRRGHRGHILSACCVRYRRDLGYLPVHEELMRRYARYTFLSLTTREADTIHQKIYIQDLITSGRLEELLGQALDPARTHVYLCGNPLMIGVPIHDRETDRYSYPTLVGVVELLEKQGFRIDQPHLKRKGNIHFEEYW